MNNIAAMEVIKLNPIYSKMEQPSARDFNFNNQYSSLFERFECYIYLYFLRSCLSLRFGKPLYKTAISSYLGRIGKNGEETKDFFQPQESMIKMYVQIKEYKLR